LRALCRELRLFIQALAAVDGSKFKAVNTRDKNFTPVKLRKRIEQVEAAIAGYLQDLDTADRQEGEAVEARAGPGDCRPANPDEGAQGHGSPGRRLARRPGITD
jgi:hypothetical protein